MEQQFTRQAQEKSLPRVFFEKKTKPWCSFFPTDAV